MEDFVFEERKPKGYWNDETNLENEAKKYQRLSDFGKYNQMAYNYARKKGEDFFNKITSHMPRPKSLIGYTDNELEKIASGYFTKRDFGKHHGGAYQVALRRGHDFFNKITSHMKKLGSKRKRLVYGYFFPKSNAVYVGLTYDIGQRNLAHTQDDKKPTSVRKYIVTTNEIPKLVKFTNYIDVDEAAKKEDEFISKFKKEGFVIINKVKGGGVGHGLKYTDEELRSLISPITDLKDFYKNHYPLYKAAQNRGKDFFNEVTKNMVRSNPTWTIELVKDFAKKVSSKTEFNLKYPNAYRAAKNMNILKDLFPEAPIPTDDEIINTAKDFDTQNDFRVAYPSLYHLADKKNLLQQIMFKKSKKKSNMLSDEDITIRAKQFTNLKDFYSKDNTAYRAAKRKGEDFYSKVTSHFK